MTEALYEAFVSIGWWEILVTMRNTLITFLIIKRNLYKPVRKMLAARTEEVESMYSTAEKAQSEAEQMRSEYTERLSKAKEEAAEIVGSATRRAAERSDEILRESSQQASAMVKKAERVIEQERIKPHEETQGSRLRICLRDDRLQDRGARCKAGGSRTLYRRLY